MTICGHRLLIAEDEPLLRITMADALRKEGWAVDVAEDGVKGSAQFEQHLHDVVLTDLVMPGMGGMDLLKRIKALQPETTVVIITAHGTVERAVEAMREGAADFITKPFSMAQLLVRLSNLCSFRLLKEQNVRLQAQLEQRYSFANIIGKSKGMQEVFELIRLVADSDASVLVLGESGTGKEMVASAIHYNSPRRTKAYVKVSCASLPESLIESELFGYEKGAFTGAVGSKPGRFELADGGTFFLDEVGEVPLPMQAKLLRVLQDGEFERVGGVRTLTADVRLICASNRDLRRGMEEGRFREDLYYRINGIPVHLPPLRDRREDILPLADFFLARTGAGRGGPGLRFSRETAEILDRYAWPGNIRELENAVGRAVALAEGEEITPPDLCLALADPAAFGEDPSPEETTFHESVREHKRTIIRRAIRQAGGNKTRAAEMLGLTPTYLSRLIRVLEVDAKEP